MGTLFCAFEVFAARELYLVGRKWGVTGRERQCLELSWCRLRSVVKLTLSELRWSALLAAEGSGGLKKGIGLQ